MDLAAADDQERRARRRALEQQWAYLHRPTKRPAVRKQQHTAVDLARSDLSSWLADAGAGSTDDGRSSPERLRDGADRLAEPAPVHPSDSDQVTLLAETLTSGTWPDITRGLDDLGLDRTAVRRQLAHHFWCDLLVGLIRLMESADRVAEWGNPSVPQPIAAAVRESSLSTFRPDVTEAVIGVVAGQVWSAFAGLALGGVPVLEVLTGDELVRGLRVLAVFICPAPEDHREVRQYAMRPLGQDGRRILTEETTSRLAGLFAEWVG